MHPILRSYFNFIKKLVPSKPDQTIVGLDIGTNECRLVEIIDDEEKLKLVNYAVVPIESASGIDEAVKKITSQITTPRTSLCTAIFGKGTLIRYIDMPRMSSSDLKNSFSLEADKYFPFPQDQIYTDCYVLDPDEKNNHMQVMAAASKKELIDQRIQMLDSIGYKTDFVSINSIALVNAMEALGFEGDSDKAAVAILDIGDSVSSLNIVINKLPRFTRDIFVGKKDFVKRIGNAMGISEADSEKILSAPGDKKEEVLAACESSVNNMLQEIRLSFDYFSTEKNAEVGSLLITGPGSTLPGIVDFVKNNLDIKVGIWDPIKFMTLASDISEEEVNKISVKFGVAIGLALYDYD